MEASLTAFSPYWSVPARRNPFFTGREAILDCLYQALHPKQNAVGTATQTYALQGLGGIGKTQIALEYAYRYALEYSAIFCRTEGYVAGRKLICQNSGAQIAAWEGEGCDLRVWLWLDRSLYARSRRQAVFLVKQARAY